jgi:hypothetical protein
MKCKDWVQFCQHTSVNDVPHEIKWSSSMVSNCEIAFYELSHELCVWYLYVDQVTPVCLYKKERFHITHERKKSSDSHQGWEVQVWDKQPRCIVCLKLPSNW